MKKDTSDNKLSDVKLSYLKNFIQGQSILDVGSGQCFYSQWLHQRDSNFNITAVDCVDLEQTPSHIGYLKLNLESTFPFQDQSFDTIIAFDVIEHIENETQLINELNRVCKNDGIIIGSVPHDNDKFLPDYNLTFYHRSDLTHKRYYLPETLYSKLCAAGFDIKTVELHGGINPQVIAEFFPKHTRFLIKKIIGMFRRMGLINIEILKSDLFFVAKKVIND
ncbi:MAG: methyltransferase domain-containing protein [Candidatus Babeliales bacterium]|jgi:2-polyprenyl-3-methyl-5-hydroxy-6-metoxy-1,4-benzoquinol methylase|nr:MAG: Methyltransferase type 11 [candidate division TM6 bacterium GW2011_GWF2_36_6]